MSASLLRDLIQDLLAEAQALAIDNGRAIAISEATRQANAGVVLGLERAAQSIAKRLKAEDEDDGSR